MNIDEQTIGQKTVSTIFTLIGEDGAREGLLDTPKRVVNMWKEIYRGYDLTQKPKITVFENDMCYNQMIHDTGYFYSQCEHHMLPFFGTFHFAYIPNKKIIGLSKISRLVDFYSAKLQVQERLVKEVIDELEKELDPLGIGITMTGRHMCKEMRGAKKNGGEMTTSDLRGVLLTDPSVKAEFFNTK